MLLRQEQKGRSLVNNRKGPTLEEATQVEIKPIQDFTRAALELKLVTVQPALVKFGTAMLRRDSRTKTTLRVDDLLGDM